MKRSRMGGDGARGDRGGKKETWRHLMQEEEKLRRGDEGVGEDKGKEEMEGRRRRRWRD